MWLHSGEATAADTAQMMRWRARSPDHARLLAEAVCVHRLIVSAGRQGEQATSATILPFVAPPAEAGPAPLRGPVGRRAFVGGAVAASAAAILAVKPPLGLWPSLAELGGDYRTGVGERKTVALAKGVTVELNTRTSIALRTGIPVDGLRLIGGEVAIDADHALRPVSVATEHGEADAHAGRFDVRLVNGKTCVICVAGSVELANASGRRTLGPSQQMNFDAERFEDVQAVDPGRSQAWRHGLLVFKNDRLSDVVDEVNRYRSGRIILTSAALGAKRVNAVFQLDRIDAATDQIRDVASARVTTLAGGIVLLS